MRQFWSFLLLTISSVCVGYRVVEETVAPTPNGSIMDNIIEKTEELFLVVNVYCRSSHLAFPLHTLKGNGTFSTI
jgi:hypothetical protein